MSQSIFWTISAMVDNRAMEGVGGDIWGMRDRLGAGLKAITASRVDDLVFKILLSSSIAQEL
ncbi:hypothetical protein FD724_06725 [Nostoc sp. C057]|uniref:hypothetical protein n=1 Tax=Nostoc sp. C057 TaxID=2576903 RepID=UPI0015C3895E|nr:hypothetical protein [Nostoc sp. C057]QLE47834.1 hypothetical protein FD724_06725 [Nostoc sp. C057]